MPKSKIMTMAGMCLTIQLVAQSPQKADSALQIPASYLDKVSTKANQLEQKLDEKTDKALLQTMRQEEKMRKKLMKIDPAKANEVFGNIDQEYADLKKRLENKIRSGQYISSLDTLSTSLRLLHQNPQLISQVKEGKEKLKDPAKIERKAIELLSKTKLFQDFIRENGMLASMFGVAGDRADPG